MLKHAGGPVLLSLLYLIGAEIAIAAEALHVQIDKLIAAGAKGQRASLTADDAEFVRRLYLDLAGRIPSIQDARAFLGDKAPDKRSRLIDTLLAGPDYPRRMQEVFHVMFLE